MEEQKPSLDSKSKLTEQIDDLIEKFTTIENKDLISIIFTVSNDLLMLCSTEGLIIKVNSTWEEQLGWSSEEMEGKQIFDFIVKDDIPHTLKAFEKVRHQQTALSRFENRYKTKDGGDVKLIWTSDKHSPVINGTVMGKARVK